MSLTQVSPPRPAGPDELPAGFVVGRHRIAIPLATGRSSSLYLAEHVETGARVAIKVMQARLARDSVARARFRREVLVLGRLSGVDNIVPIHDAGTLSDGRPYLVTELIAGPDLRQELRTLQARDERMEIPRACRILRDVARAAHEMHRAGIVHRDLEPGNIMLKLDAGGYERGFVVDFGVSADLDGDEDLTAVGEVLGRRGVMAPEQARGVTAAPSIDIFGLGLLLHETVLGTPAPEPASGVPVPILDHRNPGRALPRALTNLIGACLELKPSRRPPEAIDVVEQLDEILDQYSRPSVGIREWEGSRPLLAVGDIDLESDSTPTAPVARTTSVRLTPLERPPVPKPTPLPEQPTPAGRTKSRPPMLAIAGLTAGLVLIGAAGAMAWVQWKKQGVNAPERVAAPATPYRSAPDSVRTENHAELAAALPVSRLDLGVPDEEDALFDATLAETPLDLGDRPSSPAPAVDRTRAAKPPIRTKPASRGSQAAPVRDTPADVEADQPESETPQSTSRGADPATPPPPPPPPAPEPAEDPTDCEAARDQLLEAQLEARWTEVVELTGRTSCWNDSAQTLATRLEALYALGRFDQCVTEGTDRTEEAVQAWVRRCRKSLSQPASEADTSDEKVH